MVSIYQKDGNKDKLVCDLLLRTIDDLKKQIELTKRSSEVQINELKQQKLVLQSKLEAKSYKELSALKGDNLRLKSELIDKISELEKLRAKLSNGQNQHVQTTEVIDFSPTKESQYLNSLGEFGWIEQLLIENIADSERICAELNGKDTATKCVDSKQKS